MIKLERITKSFDGTKVIAGLSYEFEDTGIYLMTGDNGSGKSTLLYILALLDLDFEGSISFGAKRFTRRSSSVACERFRLENISLILPENNMIAFLDAGENMSLGLVRRNRAVRRQRSDSLSGGEEILVAIEREEALGHRIILLDEVTSGLDDANFTRVLSGIERLSEHSLVIFATHDQRMTSMMVDSALDEKGLLIQKVELPK